MSGKSWSVEVILKHPTLWPESPPSWVLHGLGQRGLPPVEKLSTPGFCICSPAWSLSCFLIHQAPFEQITHSLYILSVARLRWPTTDVLKPQIPHLRKPSVLAKPEQFVIQMTEAIFRFQVLPFKDSYDIHSSLIPLEADINRLEPHTQTYARMRTFYLLKILQWLPLLIDLQVGVQSPLCCVSDLPFLKDFTVYYIHSTEYNHLKSPMFWIWVGFFLLFMENFKRTEKQRNRTVVPYVSYPQQLSTFFFLL